MAWTRPPSTGTLARPADPAACAAAVTDYSTWNTLDVPGSATATSDTGAIMTSTTYNSGTNETTFTIGGTDALDVADWIFEPVDSDGTTIDLTQYDLIFHIVYSTQPSAGSNIALYAYQCEGTTRTNYYGYGCYWDTAAAGPDPVFFATGVWSPSAAMTLDAAAIQVVKIPAAMYDSGSSRYEPMGGGFLAWMRNPGTWGVDGIKYATTTNKTLGTTSSNIKFGISIGEGSSAEAVVAKIYWRAVPTISETAP